MEIEVSVSVQVVTLVVAIVVRSFEKDDEFADQNELHCCQQFPVKDKVWFPAVGGIVAAGELDDVGKSVISSPSVVIEETVG
jgi:hypothetical protein